MARGRSVGLALILLAAFATFLHVLRGPRDRGLQRIDRDDERPHDASVPNPVPGGHAHAIAGPRDMSAGNATLGFNAILALSQGTRWRVDGLAAAANASGIDLLIPAQPKWSEEFIHSFEIFGPVTAHGAAMAWLGHIDLLKFVIQNRWGSALIMEDDVDWDVRIRQQTKMIAKGVRELTRKSSWRDTRGRDDDGDQSPYGGAWDVLWMGHCSDPPPDKRKHTITAWADDTVIDWARYVGLNKHVTTVLREGDRAVHRSENPVCTFAYAVSARGAPKVLAAASTGKGGAFDLMLNRNCKDGVLDCVSVNPEVFDNYHPAGGDRSEVRAGDDGNKEKKEEEAGEMEMGHADNIGRSARCQGLWGKTCLLGD